ncbi:MAG: alpha/beta hydrolase [Gordonia sp. (in: high G+C Gram-positive bacteria)]|uniref:alpha/beta fold hydrolase n=1 Tax=Gordonia sp. (in: high G+C Gram-positive bacteria) TaxID=84139 RepID=UPI0039E573BC
MRIILVHGAWAGPWVWDGMRAEWGDRTGISAPDLRTDPATDDTDLVARIVAEIDSASRPALLVAHSGGAALALSAAEQRTGTVRGLVSIAGITPTPGCDFGDLLAELDLDLSVGIGSYLDRTPDGYVVPPEAAAAVFFHDAEPADAVRSARRMVPQSAGALSHRARWTPGGAGRLPHLYIEATLDRTVPLNVQRHLHRSAGIDEVATVCGGHALPLVHPRRLVQLITRFDSAITPTDTNRKAAHA